MTRKDYEAIASILRLHRQYIEEAESLLPFPTAYSISHLDILEGSLIELFEGENPRFDRARFLSASRATRARREAVISQLEEAK
jgi:hypothetical protein